MSLYVKQDNFQPAVSEKWVAWIDIMGTKNMFTRNTVIPTQYVLQLYKCLEEINRSIDMEIYPLVDGFYAISNCYDTFFQFLKNYFVKMFTWQAGAADYAYSFLIRAGVGYGEIIFGKDVVNSLSNDAIKNSLVFGPAIVKAAEAEHECSPFGIHLYLEDNVTYPPGISKEYYDWLKDDPTMQKNYKILFIIIIHGGITIVIGTITH